MLLDDMKIIGRCRASKTKGKRCCVGVAVLGITDEEGLGNNQGGSFIY